MKFKKKSFFLEPLKRLIESQFTLTSLSKYSFHAFYYTNSIKNHQSRMIFISSTYSLYSPQLVRRTAAADAFTVYNNKRRSSSNKFSLCFFQSTAAPPKPIAGVVADIGPNVRRVIHFYDFKKRIVSAQNINGLISSESQQY